MKSAPENQMPNVIISSVLPPEVYQDLKVRCSIEGWHKMREGYTRITPSKTFSEGRASGLTETSRSRVPIPDAMKPWQSASKFLWNLRGLRSQGSHPLKMTGGELYQR